jgi:hypothetical protein
MIGGKIRSTLIRVGKIGFWLFLIKGLLWLVIAVLGALLGSQSGLLCK